MAGLPDSRNGDLPEGVFAPDTAELEFQYQTIPGEIKAGITNSA